MGDYPNDSSRIRTYDRLLRRQLLCPAELLSQVVVPIAADSELPRKSPQLSGFPLNSYIIHLIGRVSNLNQTVDVLVAVVGSVSMNTPTQPVVC